MTPSLDNWLARSSPINEADRAAAAWSRIQDKPTSVIVLRNGVARTAQTVRIEYGNISNELQSNIGRNSVQDVIIFGIRNHATLPNTDIQRGDTINIHSARYEVESIIHTLGEVQAQCRAVGSL